MKKKLNVFCILMLVILAAEIVIGTVLHWDSFVEGWNEGAEGADLTEDVGGHPWWLFLIVAIIIVYFGIRSFISFVR